MATAFRRNRRTIPGQEPAKALVASSVACAPARLRASVRPCCATAVPEPVATDGGQHVTTARFIPPLLVRISLDGADPTRYDAEITAGRPDRGTAGGTIHDRMAVFPVL